MCCAARALSHIEAPVKSSVSPPSALPSLPGRAARKKTRRQDRDSDLEGHELTSNSVQSTDAEWLGIIHDVGGLNGAEWTLSAQLGGKLVRKLARLHIGDKTNVPSIHRESSPGLHGHNVMY